MNGYTENRAVCISRCEEYRADEIKDILTCQLNALGVLGGMADKNVVIKPNLILKSDPSKAATTHPSLIEAAAKIAYEAGAKSVTVAESSGGPYMESSLKITYKICKIDTACQSSGAVLNYDTSFSECTLDGQPINIITPIQTADIVLNIAKLKTHSLTKMTASVKNLFGCVPGIEKFATHARFPNPDNFGEYLCRLCDMIHKNTTVIDIVDAVIGMEGNGPTGGSPRKIGCILSSLNPFCLDSVCEHIMGIDGSVNMLKYARGQGFCPALSDIEIIGESADEFVVRNFKMPDSKSFAFLKHIPKFLQPLPVVMPDKCRGCGDCVNSCPQNTISIKNGRAVIDHGKCIRCFCCQELCLFRAIKVKKWFVFNFIK